MSDPLMVDAKGVKYFKTIPYMAMTIDNSMLNKMAENDLVESIQIDHLNEVSLNNTTSFIQADSVWAQGFTGEGQTVAIIDTGVDNTHDFFSGKIVSEACFSSNISSFDATSMCAGGVTVDTGVDSGRHCSVNGCDHGTHVAGIAAGIGSSISGVAKGADIIAIQVFSRLEGFTYCGRSGACALAFDSDIIEGLERVYELRNSYDIAAVNLSLGYGNYDSAEECDASNGAYLAAISNLNEAGIAVVAASGNNSYSNGLNSPACLSGVISVGAVNTSNNVQSFSNSASYLDFLAPGAGTVSSTPNNNFGTKQGTSMASPHLAGAVALLKSSVPNESLDNILNALSDTGTIVSSKGHSVPSINVNEAYKQLSGFDSSEGAHDVSIVVSADNEEAVYFNGVLMGSSTNWSESRTYVADLAPGNNVFAIHATDVDGIAALIAELNIQGLIEVSGTHWKISTTEESGWQDASFDDSGWDFATSYGQYGVEPWLSRVNGVDDDSNAQWIWSSDNLNHNEVFFRLVIENGAELELPSPEIINSELATGEANLPYSEILSAEDGEGPYRWSLVNGALPEGLVLDASGEITGTPIKEEVAVFEVQVADSNDQIDVAEFTIVVEAPNTVLISADLVISVDNKEEVYFNGVLLGADDTWSEASHYALNLVPGTNVLAVKAEDESGVAALIAQLNVQGETIISDDQWKLSTVEEQGWNEGGFDDSDWRFATSYGEYGVAPWLSRVDGLASNSQAHWIWSSDNNNHDEVYFRLVIENGVVPDSIAPNIATQDLPSGEVNVSYSETLVVDEGTAPFSWSIISGNLPEGLELNELGEIEGVPQIEETSVFEVQVTDANNDMDSRVFTLDIAKSNEIVATAELTISVDNKEQVYFNGVLIGTDDDWFESSQYTLELLAGENVLAVSAQDEGGVAALIAQLNIQGQIETSGSHWRVSNQGQAGWTEANFDDSDWDFATSYGQYGVEPWLSRVNGFDENSNAQWIWTFDNENDNDVYFRLIINM
ncbi:S8 family serine peptidase [Alteromonas sp. 5E99-2]|nr:S8 family serine peptidase [Alteromonas sp. 5E99-2]